MIDIRNGLAETLKVMSSLKKLTTIPVTQEKNAKLQMEMEKLQMEVEKIAIFFICKFTITVQIVDASYIVYLCTTIEVP